LSDALPARVIAPDVVLYVGFDVGAVIAVDGACVSGGVQYTVSVSALLFPVASRAVTVRIFLPLCSAMLLQVHDVVPEQVPLPPRLPVQVTCVIPTLSAALPLRVMEPDVVL
jgi:hypothetical protein